MATNSIKQEKLSNNLITNFIYLYHTNEWLLLPEYPEQVSDSLGSNFQQTNALSRTAPVFTFSNSGPRKVQIQLNLHRDMLYNINYGVSTFKVNVTDNYVDELISRIQAIALPKYDATTKGVVPPMVALRLGNAVFIKGVVVGGVSVVHQKPIMIDDKYAQVTLNFEICEVDPYDAESIGQEGSFRGITSMFEQGLFSESSRR